MASLSGLLNAASSGAGQAAAPDVLGGFENDRSMQMMLQLAQEHPEVIAMVGAVRWYDLQMMESMPEYQEMARSNPLLAEMMKNPENLRQTLTPENIRLAQSLQGLNLPMPGAMPNLTARRNLTSEEIRTRYPQSIQQIEEMGFTVDENLLQTLHRFNGNVEMTLNFLMQYGCLLHKGDLAILFYDGDPSFPFGLCGVAMPETTARYISRRRGRETDPEEVSREKEVAFAVRYVRNLRQR